uniref:Uncharacterized protein n=1 Tax=Atrato Sobemo-like virus 2 TaxID=2689348 RepID=A0A6B9KU82_9VIRU|nr:hypothetical protein [Atrato Sobemo-like virus 2]
MIQYILYILTLAGLREPEPITWFNFLVVQPLTWLGLLAAPPEPQWYDWALVYLVRSLWMLAEGGIFLIQRFQTFTVMEAASMSILCIGALYYLHVRYGLNNLLSYQWLRTKVLLAMGFPPPLVLNDSVAFLNATTQMESVRAGSVEHTLGMPDAQVIVGSMKNGQFNAHGCAVRLHDLYLVAPQHVLHSGSVLRGKQGAQVEYDNSKIQCLETDFALIQLTHSQMSQLGVRKPRLAENLRDTGDSVSITGVKEKGTVGTLFHDPNLFGHVTYSGTTMGGYSGAAYMQGDRVIGFHVYGGQVNGGFSASYIYAKLRKKMGIRNEDSADWLKSEFEMGHDIQYDYVDHDEVYLKVNGRFVVVDSNSVNEAFGSDWRGPDGVIKRTKRTTQLPESVDQGEDLSLNQPQGSSSLTDLGELQDKITQFATNLLKKSSHGSRRPRRASSQPAMAGRTGNRPPTKA